MQQSGIAFEGSTYIDPMLAAYVGEEVQIRYDPLDLAELRVFFEDRFVCRAICPGKGALLGVVSGSHNHVDGLPYATPFVMGAVDVVNRDRAGQAHCSEVPCQHDTRVNEHPGCPAV